MSEVILLLSVHHTGTRYTQRHLESIGVHYRQHHSEPSNYEDLHWLSGKAVVPLRDPALQWTSSHFRENLRSSKLTLDFCVTSWNLLIRLEEKFEVEHLRIEADDPQAELEKITRFCGVDPTDNYATNPVGNILKQPIGYDLWDEHKTPEIEAALRPYREHYGYNINDNG